jgi:hypothetical protein
MTGRPESYGHPGADTPDFTLPYRRPWNLLMVSREVAAPFFDARTNNALTRIFDLLPHLTWITIRTDAGDVRVSRDMMHEITDQVDGSLAAIFESNPGVTEIVFPPTPTWPQHSATRAWPRFMEPRAPLTGGDIGP